MQYTNASYIFKTNQYVYHVARFKHNFYSLTEKFYHVLLCILSSVMCYVHCFCTHSNRGLLHLMKLLVFG